MITQIQLNTKGYLDVTDDVSVPLTFSVAEIQDISKRQGGYSKTIKLPGTSNNNKLFGNLYDVNISDTSFNQNIREACIILQNGIPIFNGYLQLLNVTKISPSMGNPDEFISYEVAVKDDSGDFFSSMNDKYLTDLSGWTQYNHVYTLSAITATSSHTWGDVYKYHMTYNLKDSYSLQDFTPNIFAKVYFDKIVAQAGYTYTWNTLEDQLFDKMVIPYNGDKPLSNYSPYLFRAGIANQLSIDFGVNYGATINFNDDSNGLNFDNGNNFQNNYYQSTTYIPGDTGAFVSTFNGNVNFETQYYFEIYLEATVPCKLVGTIEYEPASLTTIKVLKSNEFSLGVKIDNYLATNVGVYGTIGIDTIFDETIITGDNSAPYTPTVGVQYPYFFGTTQILTHNTSVSIGQEIFNWVYNNMNIEGYWVSLNYDPYLPLPNLAFGHLQPGTLISSNDIPKVIIKYGTVSQNSTAQSTTFFRIAPTPNLDEGQTVVLEDFIPKQIKQKDYFSSIVKMFNLYITPDPNKDKNLIIETRDDFYTNGGIVDWTDKLDINSDTKIEFLPDLQDKRLILSYKQDKDPFNDTYQRATGEVYGQLDYVFSNEFVRNTKVIETLFSPTPLDTNSYGIVVPTIDSEKPKNNIRILYDGGWITNTKTSGYTWTYNLTGKTSVNFTAYPYMGHYYPNPITPTHDLNFAQPDYLYYNNWNNLTTANLYNLYWRRFISQIETGKLMTAKFNLREKDILNLNFRNKIWIHDTYWYLNKISDYDSNSLGLTTVELISVEEAFEFAPNYYTQAENPIATTGGKYKYVNNQDTLDTSSQKNSFGGTNSFVQVLGYNNILQPNTKQGLILGTGNNVAGSQAFIIGDDNTATGDNIMSIGLSGVNLRNPNSLTIGGPVMSYVNFIQAGRNEVLHPYGSDKLVDWIDAGRDAVRALGSASPELVIDTGRDSVL